MCLWNLHNHSFISFQEMSNLELKLHSSISPCFYFHMMDNQSHCSLNHYSDYFVNNFHHQHRLFLNNSHYYCCLMIINILMMLFIIYCFFKINNLVQIMISQGVFHQFPFSFYSQFLR